jgi:hypothetical protein
MHLLIRRNFVFVFFSRLKKIKEDDITRLPVCDLLHVCTYTGLPVCDLLHVCTYTVSNMVATS